MAANKRKDYLDIAKGLAMIWIIAVHADGAPYTGTVGYVTLIPLFFLTAGFLWKDKDEPPLGQLKKRMKPLLRPYFGYNAALFVLYLIDQIPYIVPKTRETCLDILRHVVGVFYSEGQILMNDQSGTLLRYFTQFNYPLWFLTAMVTASAAFLLLLWLRRRFIWPLKAMILPCILVTIALNHLPVRLPWNLNNCLLAAALMAVSCGMTFSRSLLRTMSGTAFELSSTNVCCSSASHARISCRERQSSGRTTLPWRALMPVSPWMPVPRRRFIRMVSTESSLWWAMQMVLAPTSRRNCSK